MEDIVTCKILEVDLDKVFILRDVCTLPGTNIVVSSEWRKL